LVTRLPNQIGLNMTSIQVDELTKEWILGPDEDLETWHLREAPDEAGLYEHADSSVEPYGGGHA
jgi:hypothetical protein